MINDEQGPETLHGHVKSIGWCASNAPAALDGCIPEQPQPQLQNIEQAVDRLGNLLVVQTLSLKRTFIVSFLAALALILVSHFLR
jgi:hypothetical protein